MLVSNMRHGTIEAVAVRAPGFGHRRIQHLGDLAAFCGGTVIAEEAGLTLTDVTPEHFGTARRVIVTADDCTFIEGGGDGRGRRRAGWRSCASSWRARSTTATSRSCRSGSRGCRPTWP